MQQFLRPCDKGTADNAASVFLKGYTVALPKQEGDS